MTNVNKMTRDEIKSQIKTFINCSHGVKATDLILKLISNNPITDDLNYITCVEELVKSGDIIEIEFTVPQMDYRIKSFYLPVGTRIKIVDKSKPSRRKHDNET